MMAIEFFGYVVFVPLMRGKAAAAHTGKDVSNNLSWERPLEVIRCNLLLRSGPASKLDEVTQDLVQSSSENVQGWGLYHISGQLYPVYDHPH